MILITTPGGKVGSEIVKVLQARGDALRLGAHTVEKARKDFPSAEIVHFDFGDEASVRAALKGVTALYLAAPGEMPADPVKRVVDLAKEAGVKRVVKLSALGAEQGENPLRDAERHIEGSGLAWTFLRPSWFMQNYSTLSAQSIREQGAIMEPAGDAATGFVDARDIAALGVAALTEDGHAGQAYAITGPAALTRQQVAAAISAATGREVRYVPVSEEQFQGAMSGAGMPAAYVGLMTGLYAMVRAGYTATVTDDVQRVTGRAPISFEQFARDHVTSWQ